MNGNNQTRVGCWWPLHFPTPIELDEVIVQMNRKLASTHPMALFSADKDNELRSHSYFIRHSKYKWWTKYLVGDSDKEQWEEDQ